MVRALSTTLVGVLVFGCTSSNGSGGPPLRPVTGDAAPLRAAVGDWSVELVDAWGRPMPTFGADGATWVEGRYGEAYSVRVTNRSNRRVEAVVSVDGRDVVSGEPGDFRAQRGYIVEPFGTVTIEGFRQSADNVATFRFTDPGDSYAGRLGGGANIGVVGVAVFAEGTPQAIAQPPAPPPRPSFWGDFEQDRPEGEASAQKGGDDLAPGRATAAAPSERAPDPRAGNLGTRYGETRHAPSVEVPFVRGGDTPAALIGVYYDDREGLVARGVVPAPPPLPPTPQPFPGAQTFAPPPP